MAVGTGVTAASNVATTTMFGPEVAGVALLTNMLFQWVKKFEWFDHHRWWPLALVVIAVLAFMGIHHDDIAQAIWKGGAAAFQAAANYAGQKASGLGIFEPAQNLPTQGG